MQLKNVVKKAVHWRLTLGSAYEICVVLMLTIYQTELWSLPQAMKTRGQYRTNNKCARDKQKMSRFCYVIIVKVVLI